MELDDDLFGCLGGVSRSRQALVTTQQEIIELRDEVERLRKCGNDPSSNIGNNNTARSSTSQSHDVTAHVKAEQELVSQLAVVRHEKKVSLDEVRNMTEVISTLREELQSINNENDKLKTTVGQHEATIQKLEYRDRAQSALAAKCKKIYEDSNTAFEKLKTLFQTNKGESSTLKSDLKHCMSKLETLTKREENVSATCIDLKKKYSLEQMQNLQLRSTIDKLELGNSVVTELADNLSLKVNQYVELSRSSASEVTHLQKLLETSNLQLEEALCCCCPEEAITIIKPDSSSTVVTLTVCTQTEDLQLGQKQLLSKVRSELHQEREESSRIAAALVDAERQLQQSCSPQSEGEVQLRERLAALETVCEELATQNKSMRAGQSSAPLSPQNCCICRLPMNTNGRRVRCQGQGCRKVAHQECNGAHPSDCWSCTMCTRSSIMKRRRIQGIAMK